jgi:hypothetical protein
MNVSQNLAKFEDLISIHELSTQTADNTVVAAYATRNLTERAIRALYLCRTRLDEVSVLGKVDATHFPVIASIATQPNFSIPGTGLNPLRFGPWKLLSDVGLFAIRGVGCVIVAGRFFETLMTAAGKTASGQDPLRQALIHFGFAGPDADYLTRRIDRSEFILIARGDSSSLRKTENLLSLMRAQYISRFCVIDRAEAETADRASRGAPRANPPLKRKE